MRRIAILAAFLMLSLASPAENLDAAESALRNGKYEEAGRIASTLTEEGAAVVRVRALMAQGKYAAARGALEAGLEQHGNSLRLRLEGIEVLRMNDDAAGAEMLREQMDRLGGTRAWAYRAPADRIALARAALQVGADPKRVLDALVTPVQKEAPEFRDAWLVAGELALSKDDYALAARKFGQAAKKFPDDADAHFGLARAFAPSDGALAAEALEKALALNPNHLGALLLRVENAIHSEDYASAARHLATALAVNPAHPLTHALSAVLAHLQGDAKSETTARAKALAPWSENPSVPHLIGARLSARYRFAEGAAEQRTALKFDPDFLPAKIALANDLLRLGDSEEGWQLAEEVFKADAYNVIAYNLVNLREVIAKMRVLKSQHFTVKMDAREAEIYGPAVIDLLESAHATLTKKYGLTLKERTIVEIFADQKDFAIRTFGLPGGNGYLGVCFGRLITANSPAARAGSTANWQAVLWHEFGHVVTLTLTRNKIPRWLSEGISVYEERQRRAQWGEQMNPRYRRMILGEDLTPVSQLSGAFLKPKSPFHLQFAYYQSSLVVQWLVEKWGMSAMQKCLADLGRGISMNAALERHFAPLPKLDSDFADYARKFASAVGPKLDWQRPPRGSIATPQTLDAWLAVNPDNFTALDEQARRRIAARDWQGAKAPLLRLIQLYPEQHDADSAYALLAKVHRQLGEASEELAMLRKVVTLSAEAVDAHTRLMELARERRDWAEVLSSAEAYAAVNPLSPIPHRFAAQANEALGQIAAAVANLRALLALEPVGTPRVRYDLARLLHAAGDGEAKRQVLLALEEAPRFREALGLLRKITR